MAKKKKMRFVNIFGLELGLDIPEGRGKKKTFPEPSRKRKNIALRTVEGAGAGFVAGLGTAGFTGMIIGVPVGAFAGNLIGKRQQKVAIIPKKVKKLFHIPKIIKRR